MHPLNPYTWVFYSYSIVIFINKPNQNQYFFDQYIIHRQICVFQLQISLQRIIQQRRRVFTFNSTVIPQITSELGNQVFPHPRISGAKSFKIFETRTLGPHRLVRPLVLVKASEGELSLPPPGLKRSREWKLCKPLGR